MAARRARSPAAARRAAAASRARMRLGLLVRAVRSSAGEPVMLRRPAFGATEHLTQLLAGDVTAAEGGERGVGRLGLQLLVGHGAGLGLLERRDLGGDVGRLADDGLVRAAGPRRRPAARRRSSACAVSASMRGLGRGRRPSRRRRSRSCSHSARRAAHSSGRLRRPDRRPAWSSSPGCRSAGGAERGCDRERRDGAATGRRGRRRAARGRAVDRRRVRGRPVRLGGGRDRRRAAGVRACGGDVGGGLHAVGRGAHLGRRHDQPAGRLGPEVVCSDP